MTLLILQNVEKCVWFAYSTTKGAVLIIGCLENVLFVSVSITGVTLAGGDVNSDSFTVRVAELDVTVVAFAFVNTQRNCSAGVVGYTVTGVVYDAVFAPFIFTTATI